MPLWFKPTLCSTVIGNAQNSLRQFSPAASLEEANKPQGQQHPLSDITYLEALITAEVPAQGLHNGKAQGALRKPLRQYMSDLREEQGYAQVA